MWKIYITVNFLSAKIESVNAVQKYPHITESFACTQKVLFFMFLFQINFLICSGTCSTPKLSK